MRRGSLKSLDEYRQSTLNGFTVCARRTRFALQVGDDATTGWVESTGDLGTAFHHFMRRYLETLYRHGERQMATQEAVEVMYEALTELPFALPHADLDSLRGMVLGFCTYEWAPQLIMALEMPLRHPVECPDGKTRILKGQPDVVLADPPDGIVIGDAKSGRGRPKGPRQDPAPGEVVEGKQYLSDRGHFQGDAYALLALKEWPAAQRIVFREFHLRSGQIRQVTLGRDELEHVERKLATTMMLLDQAIAEGPKSERWGPRPGSHCGKACPVSRSCRIPREMRGAGAIATPAQANMAAARFAKLEGERATLREALKAWENEPEHPHALANDQEEVRWGPDGDARLAKGNGRSFGIWPRQNGSA